MNNISDNELFSMALEENEDAKNELYERYKYIIDILISKYSKIAYQLGIESKELYSEGLYGFSDALANYNQDKPASIATFITLCVERRICKAIGKAQRVKNKINVEAFSLDYVYEQFGTPLMELISDDYKFEPLNNITKEESYQELLNQIKKELSEFEYSVFTFLANGFDYTQIANILDKSPKQIDNTMQRLKVKLKKILENKKIA